MSKHSKFGLPAHKIAKLPAKYHYDILLKSFAEFLVGNGLKDVTFVSQWSEGHTSWLFYELEIVVATDNDNIPYIKGK